jgi:hypothetical protein
MKKFLITITFVLICVKVPVSKKLDKFEPPIIELTGSVYNATVKQCDADPLTTASTSKINLKKLKKGQIRWVALSRDLLKRWGGKIDYNDSIYIIGGEKEGWWVVKDCMNKRYKNRVDFLTYKEKRFKENVKIIVKHGER